MSWNTKYEPKTIKDFVNNKSEINAIKKILEKDNANIIVSGDSGTGKNAAIKIILQSLNYKIDTEILRLIKEKNKLSYIVETITNTNNIFDDKKYAIIINDIKNITSKEEKKILTALCKRNKTNPIITIVFIVNTQHNKYINELKKFAKEYKFSPPTFDEMKTIFNKIKVNENIIFEKVAIENSIIRYAQFDFTRLINIMYELHITYQNNTITLNDYNNFITQTTKKDTEIRLFDASRSLLDGYKSINHCLNLYAEEKVLLPLTLYSNYLRNIFAREEAKEQNTLKNIKQQLNVARTIGDFYSKGDVIETNIYTDQSWINQIIYGFYTLAICSYTLNTELPPPSKYYDITFNPDLNKNSLRNINKKKTIAPLQDIFKGYTLDDLLYVNKIVQYHVNNDQNDIALEYCNKNNCLEILHKQKKKNQTNITQEDSNKKCLELVMKINKK